MKTRYRAILAGIKKGERYKDIAERLGVSVQRVSVVARENGFRRTAPRSDKTKPDVRTPQITALGLRTLATRNRVCLALSRGEKMTAREIAELLCMTERAVDYVRRKYRHA